MSAIIRILSIYLFLGVLLASFISAYAVAKGNSQLNRIFAIMSSLVGIFLFGYLLELNSDSLPQMTFWNQIQYIVQPFYPAVWLLLSMTYTERRSKKNLKLKRLLVFVIPVLTFFIRLTNDWHHLYYRSMMLDRTADFPVMLLGKGPWYYFNWIYLGACLIYASYLFLDLHGLEKGMKKGHYLMLTSSLIPYLGMTLIIINPGDSGLDYAALVMPVSLLLVTIALFKYDLLNVQTLARDIVFEKGKDALILIDAQHMIKDSNQLAKVIFPELKAGANGSHIADILAHRHDLLMTIKSVDLTEKAFQIRIQENFYEVQIIRLLGSTGFQSGSLISLSDITEKRRFQEKLKTMATLDGLTGLNNRATFIELAEQALQQAIKTNHPCSVYMLDIDHFKKINDTYGHSAGDQILKVLSEKMKTYFRVNDILGRMGGEEFALLLPGASLAHSQKVVDRFREEVAGTPVIHDSHTITLTVSIGAAELNQQTSDLDELLRQADEALYAAKNSGRNQLIVRTNT